MWVYIPLTNSQGKREGEDVLMSVMDGTKFVKMFSGIIDESTPHLYLSALPFSPSNSIMARNLLDRFPGIAKVVVGQHCVWPGLSQPVLQGHANWIGMPVAFSPDGRHIVSGSFDGTIQLWDAQGDQVGTPLQGHTSSIKSVVLFITKNVELPLGLLLCVY